MSETSSTATAFQASVLEAKAQAFVKNLADAGGPPIHTLSFEDARRALAAIQSCPVVKLPALVEDTIFPVGPTGAVNVRIVRPEGADGIMPAVVYFHGGGWVMGNKGTHDRLIRELANGAEAVVVFVDYTPVPEARYPVQNEQAYAALKYVAERADSLNIDPCRIAVAGDSVGGNMAAAVTLLAKARRGPNIVLQVLFYPVTADVADTGSYETFKDGPWLTKPAIQYFLDAFFPDAASRSHITAFPLSASLDQLDDLPEALIIVAENDLLRDEGEAYARKLAEAGVGVTSTRYNGTIHDFVMLNPLAEARTTRAAIAQANAALRAAFYSN